MARVFIMAQGQQSRMHQLTSPKQLLRVGDETLLGRICRQVSERCDIPTVVARHFVFASVLAEWPSGLSIEHRCLRYPGICILDGMHATSPWWCDDRNIFLLGDVCYSEAAMDTIFGFEGEVQFFGTHDVGRASGELFAFSMCGPAVDQTAELLLIVDCRGVKASTGQGGHLRNLLWLWMRVLGAQPDAPCEYSPKAMTVISDWTSDIDTDAQVRDLLPVLDRHVREERHGAIVAP